MYSLHIYAVIEQKQSYVVSTYIVLHILHTITIIYILATSRDTDSDASFDGSLSMLYTGYWH